MEEKKLITGGEFLVKDTDIADVFIPEELDEEQRMIGETCTDFLETEVFPVADRIDAQEEGLMRSFWRNPVNWDSLELPFLKSMKDSDKTLSPPCMPVRYGFRIFLCRSIFLPYRDWYPAHPLLWKRGAKGKVHS